MIAITGTPGTGKTTAAEFLRKRGREVESVLGLARRFNCCPARAKGEIEIDTRALSIKLKKAKLSETIVEGHLSHWLSPDICIVLRCSPKVVERRLAGRRYTEAKLRANVEAEAVGVILVEAMQNCPDVRELDTTRATPSRVASAIGRIIDGKGPQRLPGKVDWSSEVLAWY